MLPLECKPKLAKGCNLSVDATQTPVILIPEGVIKLKGTSLEILKHCDGAKSIADVIAELQKKYKGDTKAIAREVQSFLSKLAEKKVISIE